MVKDEIIDFKYKVAANLEKAGIDPIEVVDNVKKNWPRAAVCAVVFLLELWFVVSYARYHYKYGSVGGLYFFIKLLIILTIFELLRWSDAVYEKYYLKRSHSTREI